MPLYYNNADNPYRSEAERTWTTAQDWTTHGVAELSLWFQGYPPAFVETAPGSFTMSAAGSDIWYAADEFRFAFKSLNGDGALVARVDSLTTPDPWTKAGVMIRRTLDAGSPFAAVYMTGANGVRYQARLVSSVDAVSDSPVATAEQIAFSEPNWIKIERTGDAFNGYYSTDGISWTAMSWNPQQITMTGNVYIGLAVTSHSAGNAAAAAFSGVEATGGVFGAWQVEEIGVDHPANDVDNLYVTLQDSMGRTGHLSGRCQHG